MTVIVVGLRTIQYALFALLISLANWTPPEAHADLWWGFVCFFAFAVASLQFVADKADAVRRASDNVERG